MATPNRTGKPPENNNLTTQRFSLTRSPRKLPRKSLSRLGGWRHIDWRQIDWRKGGRLALWGLVFAGLLGALGLGLGWTGLRGRAVLATSYAARVACSCHYVDGRDMKQCRGDLEPGTGLVMLSDNAAHQTITARLIPLTATSATYHAGQGCVLEHWAD